MKINLPNILLSEKKPGARAPVVGFLLCEVHKWVKQTYGVKSQDQFDLIGTGDFGRFSEDAHRMLTVILFLGTGYTGLSIL